MSKGFTLIEMMVVMAVFLLITSAAIGIFISIVKSENSILSEQQALSQMSYIQGYMSQAIKSAVTDQLGTCVSFNPVSNQPRTFLPGYNADKLYTSIQFLNGSDKTDSFGNPSSSGTPVCDKFYLDGNILMELKTYGPTYLSGTGPVALSSSVFDISAIRFAIDGINKKSDGSGMLNKKSWLLADANKNYLGNSLLTFKDGTQLAQSGPAPTSTPVYCDDSQGTYPNPECTSGYCDSSHNVCTNGAEGDGCGISDDCNFDLGLVCNLNGLCGNPGGYFPIPLPGSTSESRITILLVTPFGNIEFTVARQVS